MATDYDAPRKNDDEPEADSIEELTSRQKDQSSAAIEEDENEAAEGFELPGADLSREELSVHVVPQLERRAAQRQDDGGDGAVGRLLQTQLHPVNGRDLQRPQVDTGHLLLVLGQLTEVPGAGGGLVEVVVAGVAPENGLVRIGGCVVTTAREQSHGDLLSWVGASAGAVGAHRKTGRFVDEGQLAAVMDEEAL